MVFNAETMPWQWLRRPHALKVRSLLEENYLSATANRMLSALRGGLPTYAAAFLGATTIRLGGITPGVRWWRSTFL